MKTCTRPLREVFAICLSVPLFILPAAISGQVGTALASGCSGTAIINCTYSYTGAEATLTLAPRVTTIHVVAIGGSGGSDAENDNAGGNGAMVTADVPVSSPITLYVDVGGNGDNAGNGGLSGALSSGGKGGTYYGAGTTGGGGGGATVLQTCPQASGSCTSLYYGANEPRFVVAGGGGGEGGRFGGGGGNGGGGVGTGPFTGGGCSGGGGGGSGTGGSGELCQDGGGGGGASPTTVGTAGSGDSGGTGSSGVNQAGGNGYPSATQAAGGGGGGGGGYYGGGGGGTDKVNLKWGGGGGAGSSAVQAGASNVSYANDTSGTPSLTISYRNPTAVAYARLRVRFARKWTTMRWETTEPVAGYNVFNGRSRLNHRLVVSRTRYFRFRIERRVQHPRIVPVQYR